MSFPRVEPFAGGQIVSLDKSNYPLLALHIRWLGNEDPNQTGEQLLRALKKVRNSWNLFSALSGTSYGIQGMGLPQNLTDFNDWESTLLSLHLKMRKNCRISDWEWHVKNKHSMCLLNILVCNQIDETAIDLFKKNAMATLQMTHALQNCELARAAILCHSPPERVEHLQAPAAGSIDHLFQTALKEGEIDTARAIFNNYHFLIPDLTFIQAYGFAIGESTDFAQQIRQTREHLAPLFDYCNGVYQLFLFALQDNNYSLMTVFPELGEADFYLQLLADRLFVTAVEEEKLRFAADLCRDKSQMISDASILKAFSSAIANHQNDFILSIRNSEKGERLKPQLDKIVEEAFLASIERDDLEIISRTTTPNERRIFLDTATSLFSEAIKKGKFRFAIELLEQDKGAISEDAICDAHSLALRERLSDLALAIRTSRRSKSFSRRLGNIAKKALINSIDSIDKEDLSILTLLSDIGDTSTVPSQAGFWFLRSVRKGKMQFATSFFNQYEERIPYETLKLALDDVPRDKRTLLKTLIRKEISDSIWVESLLVADAAGSSSSSAPRGEVARPAEPVAQPASFPPFEPEPDDYEPLSAFFEDKPTFPPPASFLEDDQKEEVEEHLESTLSDLPPRKRENPGRETDPFPIIKRAR